MRFGCVHGLARDQYPFSAIRLIGDLLKTDFQKHYFDFIG
jgi:hypothetical protein